MFVYCYIAVTIHLISLNAFAMVTYQPCIKPPNFTKTYISNNNNLFIVYNINTGFINLFFISIINIQVEFNDNKNFIPYRTIIYYLYHDVFTF